MIYINWKEINPLYFIISTWGFLFMAIISFLLKSGIFFTIFIFLFIPVLILGFTRSLGHLSKMDDRYRFLYFFLALANALLFLGFLFPPCKPPVNPDYKDRAMINAIYVAVKMYQDEYKTLPCDNSESDKIFSETNSLDYDTLFEILSGIDGPDDAEEVTFNKRKMKFLYTWKGYRKNGFIDPYGNRFKIILDSNYDNQIIIGDDKIETFMSVYSFGKNEKDDKGGKDDICSWK